MTKTSFKGLPLEQWFFSSFAQRTPKTINGVHVPVNHPNWAYNKCYLCYNTSLLCMSSEDPQDPLHGPLGDKRTRLRTYALELVFFLFRIQIPSKRKSIEFLKRSSKLKSVKMPFRDFEVVELYWFVGGSNNSISLRLFVKKANDIKLSTAKLVKAIITRSI